VIPVRADVLPGCRVVAGDGATLVRGVAIDSREVSAGDLFVAIRNGHAHTAAARAAGAVAVLVDEAQALAEEGLVLAARDTVEALGAIGAVNVRAAAGCRVVAITGSSGKTSTKDATAALVSSQRHVVAARAGHNNEIGLPFTLTRIGPDTEVAICEVAMRGPGEIAYLAALARPRIGVVTNVGEAHIGRLGSRDAIGRAKGELLDALPDGGVAIVPDDEPLLEPHLRDTLVVVRFGESSGADVRLRALVPLAHGMRTRFDVYGTPLTLETPFVGRHHALNLAAALGVCTALQLDLRVCVAAARQIALQRWRSEDHPLPGGGVVVNDAYNANPSSTEAALAALVSRPGGRVVAVLGEMAELGDHAEALHLRVGATAAGLGVGLLVGVGPLARHYLEGAAGAIEEHWLESGADVVDYVAPLLRPDDRVLVKASRSVGLEDVAAGLAARLSKRGAG
jgi:UDP-N-acetylmuramoyl-tripeptide--D-alanyl-D-alanine ligase